MKENSLLSRIWRSQVASVPAIMTKKMGYTVAVIFFLNVGSYENKKDLN